MAKRVAAQRRGFLYGMIASIFVAVILAILLFWQASEKTKVLQAIDPTAADPAEVQKQLTTTGQDLAARGITVGKTPLTKVMTQLIDQNKSYEQALGELASLVSPPPPGAELHGEALTAFIKDRYNAGDTALVTATEALTIAPTQAENEKIVAAKPTDLAAAVKLMKTHLEALSAVYKKKLGDIETAKTEIAAAKTKNDQDLKSDQDKFNAMLAEKDKAIADQTTMAERAKTDSAEYLKDKDATREALIKAQNDAKAEAAKLKNENVKLELEIAEIVQRLKRASVGQFTSDGKIVRLAPGSTAGYINLAKGDGVFPNLTFAVYSSAEVGKEDAKEKGFVRLTNVMGDSSEFAIVTQRKSDPIVEGDLVANAVYDRTRHFHFAVVGRFDLGSGPGHDDVDMVKKLIEQFGGKIDPEINVNTDYLVVGEDPMSAVSTVAIAGASPQQQVAQTNAVKEQTRMSNATDFAKRLWIPALNQNRFLTLIGMKPADAK